MFSMICLIFYEDSVGPAFGTDNINIIVSSGLRFVMFFLFSHCVSMVSGGIHDSNVISRTRWSRSSHNGGCRIPIKDPGKSWGNKSSHTKWFGGRDFPCALLTGAHCPVFRTRPVFYYLYFQHHDPTMHTILTFSNHMVRFYRNRFSATKLRFLDLATYCSYSAVFLNYVATICIFCYY